MNAPLALRRPFFFTPAMAEALSDQLMRVQVDRWAIIRIAARAIGPDVDLDNECAVALALLLASFGSWQIADILSDVIELARQVRGRE